LLEHVIRHNEELKLLKDTLCRSFIKAFSELGSKLGDHEHHPAPNELKRYDLANKS
jgi:hypothetical protein